jgi:hypothetical protein
MSRNVFIIISVLVLFVSISTLKGAKNSNPLNGASGNLSGDKMNAYTDIVLFKNMLIAVGSDGRITRITKSGKEEPIEKMKGQCFNCAYADNEMIVIVGENGKIFYSSNGKEFSEAETGIEKNILGITRRKGLFVASSEEGLLLVSTDGNFWKELQTTARGNIISVSSNNNVIIGVSDAGEIIKSAEGKKWEVTDYNKQYEGFYPYSNFEKVLAVRHSIVIIGTHEDESPSILISSLGNVWSERIPYYINENGLDSFLTNKPNDITYDPDRDQFVLACDGGVLFSLPSCNKCNEYYKISENNLMAIIYYDNYFLITGDGYSVFVQN